jgi:hypothetical protein
MNRKIPDNFYGPVRPIGVDWQGDFTYMKEYVDPEKTGLLDPSIKMILGLGLRS